MKHCEDELINKALFIEKSFSQNNYLGEIGGDLFRYIRGEVPIVVSAPHAVKQIRNGKYKPADIYTGSLSILLNELTNCHLIYRSYTGYGDANRDPGCTYKRRLLEVIEEYKIKYLIDLHGMSKRRGFDIDIGTLEGKTTNSSIEKDIMNSFKKFGILDIRFDYLFNADKRGTVTRTIWQEADIQCFQMEINGVYRELKFQGNYNCYYRLVCSLEDLILRLIDKVNKA